MSFGAPVSASGRSGGSLVRSPPHNRRVRKRRMWWLAATATGIHNDFAGTGSCRRSAARGGRTRAAARRALFVAGTFAASRSSDGINFQGTEFSECRLVQRRRLHSHQYGWRLRRIRPQRRNAVPVRRQPVSTRDPMHPLCSATPRPGSHRVGKSIPHRSTHRGTGRVR